NAFELFRNQVPSYCNAVALDNGSYKTVGCSFEFGGLANNAQNTKEELMILILEFFGDIITVTDELSEGSATEIIAWPNPFREKINFSFTLENPGMVKLQVRNINGQIVHEKTHAGLQAGLQAISWDGCSDEGFPLSAGMYIYVIDFEGSKSSGKILLSN
ncbi:MAG TPA: FlgD immunoglobulin-like domain containing protein, partial [Bacteroidales bacterium]|nr:FlgD immunoglobulin-like domain containing protein [Bacteroidales bacterium]